MSDRKSNKSLRRAALALRNANYWWQAKAVVLLLRLVRLMPMEGSLAAIDWLARRVGPLTGRHRLALDNLRQAYPGADDAALQQIASDMWGNMARLAVEYVFLDRLVAGGVGIGPENRIEVVGYERLFAFREDGTPHILFTAHTGNFEMLAAVASAYGIELASLFRTPNNPYVARELAALRGSTMGTMLESRPGVTFTMARILSESGNVGALVDQKFRQGVRTTFFGRECLTSPLLPRLARQFECPLVPARCIRLPNNRFRIEIEAPLELPRKTDGAVDADRLTQIMNDVVERWVREYPGQWTWFHRRWQTEF